MSEVEEQLFQQSNSCWILKKLIDQDNEKVIDHCHVTGKFRGAAYWSCNINFQLTKKIPIIFHNLRGYNSHLIFSKLNKFDVKISVISNGLEKYMIFFSNKTLVFIDSIQVLNSSFDNLVEFFSGEDFQYLVKEFGSKYLELLEREDSYLYEYMNSFENLNEKKLPARKYFFSSTRKGKIDNVGEISEGQVI